MHDNAVPEQKSMAFGRYQLVIYKQSCVLLFCLRHLVLRVLCVVVSNDVTANSSLPPCNADRAMFLKKALVPLLIEDMDYRSERPKRFKSRELDVTDVSAAVV